MDHQTIIPLAFKKIEDLGWSAFNLKDFAYDLKIPYETLLCHIPDKTALVTRVLEQTAQETRDATPPLETECTKDQLLDLILSHLDKLEPFKPALMLLENDFASINTPKVWGCLEGISRSFMIKASLRPAGLLGHLKVQGLTGIYLATLQTWIHDDTAGLESTMLFLDKRLREGEELSALLGIDDSVR